MSFRSSNGTKTIHPGTGKRLTGVFPAICAAPGNVSCQLRAPIYCGIFEIATVLLHSTGAMYWLLSIVVAGSALVDLAAASKLTPPVLPLIVRNPYLSTWLGDARISPWNKWPMFWTGEEASTCL